MKPRNLKIKRIPWQEKRKTYHEWIVENLEKQALGNPTPENMEKWLNAWFELENAISES